MSRGTRTTEQVSFARHKNLHSPRFVSVNHSRKEKNIACFAYRISSLSKNDLWQRKGVSFVVSRATAVRNLLHYFKVKLFTIPLSTWQPFSLSLSVFCPLSNAKFNGQSSFSSSLLTLTVANQEVRMTKGLLMMHKSTCLHPLSFFVLAKKVCSDRKPGVRLFGSTLLRYQGFLIQITNFFGEKIPWMTGNRIKSVFALEMEMTHSSHAVIRFLSLLATVVAAEWDWTLSTLSFLE